MTFHDDLVQSAARFVQTAVVVDDQAFMQSQQTTAPTEQAESGIYDTKTPGLPEEGDSAAPTTGRRDSADTREREVNPEPDRDLNAKVLIDAFADKGLICAVLKPLRGEDIVGRTVKIARRSDLVVLDWKLYDSVGGDTLEILGRIIKEDNLENKTRVVAVYTAESTLGDIARKVEERATSELSQDRVKVSSDGFTISAGSVVVDIIEKEPRGLTGEASSTKNDSDSSPRIRKIEQLPEHLIGLYADLVNGLIPRAVITSLSRLREQLPRLLSVFNKDLDASYLSNRGLLSNPDDAATLILNCITSEITHIVQSEDVLSQLRMPSIEKWVDQKIIIKPFRMEFDTGATIELDRQKTIDLIDGKLSNIAISTVEQTGQVWKEDKVRKLLPRLTEFFTGGLAEALRIDARYAMITSLAKRADGTFIFDETNSPYLHLGSIVERIDQRGSYLFCLQPLCDSIRLKDSANFPFLPLEEVEYEPKNTQRRFDLVACDESSSPKLLKLRLKPKEIQLIRFDPNVGEAIKAVCDDPTSNSVFFISTDGNRYRWAGELKEAHSQRIVHKFANEVSRVGLDESEWLRRWGSNEWRLNE